MVGTKPLQFLGRFPTQNPALAAPTIAVDNFDSHAGIVQGFAVRI
jgi:hypothetical protein